MESILAVLRINPAYLGDIAGDSYRFERVGLLGLRYEIPTIQVLAIDRNSGGKLALVDRPLLISYGFLRIPRNFAKNPNRLQQIKSLSRFIRGFFYKTSEELAVEESSGKSLGDLAFRPVLIKSIKDSQLDLLYETAARIKVRNSQDDIGVGDYIILRGYPFEGLGAEVLRKKVNGKLQVELLESRMILWVSAANVFYSQPMLDDPFE